MIRHRHRQAKLAMMKKIAELFLLVIFLSTPLTAIAVNHFMPKVEGKFFARFPGQKKYVIASESTLLADGTILLVRPDVQQPMASASHLIIGSHSLTLFPGSSVRLARGGLYPLSGRFEINTDQASTPILIYGKKFYLQYQSGHLMLEVTPDSGTYLVMLSKGQAFVKDLDRQIVELETDQEIYFPLFGAMKKNRHLSSFWKIAPTGFAAARTDGFVAAEESDDAGDEQSEKLAVEVASATDLKLIPGIPVVSELSSDKQPEISAP